ncbi:MAG: aminodeoxychorismate synthase component I [Wenzhouxiangella sp.]|nr:MAG: aminodeoxychorismate synthase component I [Wenzhouxiangella sp.]
MNEFCARRLPGLPNLLKLHRHAPAAWPYLLASEAGAGSLGRWSLLMRQSGRVITRSAGADSPAGFLDGLRRAMPAGGIRPAGLPDLPFFGGWFVYLAYELAAEIEPSLDLPAAEDGLPMAYAARCPGAVLVDHLEGQAWLAAETPSWLERIADELPGDLLGDTTPAAPAPIRLALQVDPGETFMRGVARIRDWILDGDVFQVNLSRGWHAQSTEEIDPSDVYRALAASNPAPFAGLARLPGGTVVSSSPERLVSVIGDRVQTRPIAGTRPRGSSPEEDLGLSSELIAHPKERAEHIMLIDLERNDLGRVCVSGTVEVDELMVVESYAHVHHIVSNVTGRLRPGTSAADTISAVFPGGTITGCPKVRCMEIIAELERAGRGFYTGSMGYIGLDGSMDFNILIRSMVVGAHSLSFRTGAGIVADSDPAAELAETEAKARGLLKALGAA